MAERNRIVIITGAGASRDLAVKGRLPLMSEWAKILRDDFDAVESGLAEAIGLHSTASAEEFEEIMGAISRWDAALPLVERFKLVGGAPNPNSLDSYVQSWLERSQARSRKITRALHQSLYREFGRETIDASKAGAALSALIDILGGRMSKVLFATTNYDPSIEVGLAENGFHPLDGFHRTPWESPQLEVANLGDWDKKSLEEAAVLHLHGAVGWYRRSNGSITYQSPDQPFNPTLGTPVVLAPDPSKDPFSDAYVAAIWGELEKALASSTHILVIGHSMHDAPLIRTLEKYGGAAKLAITYYRQIDGNAQRIEQEDAIELRTQLKGTGLQDALLIPTRYGPQPELAGVRKLFLQSASGA